MLCKLLWIRSSFGSGRSVLFGVSSLRLKVCRSSVGSLKVRLAESMGPNRCGRGSVEAEAMLEDGWAQGIWRWMKMRGCDYNFWVVLSGRMSR